MHKKKKNIREKNFDNNFLRELLRIAVSMQTITALNKTFHIWKYKLNSLFKLEIRMQVRILLKNITYKKKNKYLQH